MRYLADIHRECTNHACFRVLIEERLEGPRLGSLDVFDIASEGKDHVAGKLPIIAYVDVNAAGTLMKFAEDVAVNRGIYVRVFPSVADAEKWLIGLDTTDTRSRPDIVV